MHKKRVIQVGNALKTNENNQIITACNIKIYQYQMKMNEKLTMIGLSTNKLISLLLIFKPLFLCGEHLEYLKLDMFMQCNSSK